MKAKNLLRILEDLEVEKTELVEPKVEEPKAVDITAEMKKYLTNLLAQPEGMIEALDMEISTIDRYLDVSDNYTWTASEENKPLVKEAQNALKKAKDSIARVL